MWGIITGVSSVAVKHSWGRRNMWSCSEIVTGMQLEKEKFRSCSSCCVLDSTSVTALYFRASDDVRVNTVVTWPCH